MLLCGCTTTKWQATVEERVGYDQAVRIAAAWSREAPTTHAWVPVLGTGSMKPTLDEHCLLLLVKVTAKELKPGDIAIYVQLRDASKTTVHRVVTLDKWGNVLFTGDHNVRHDQWVTPERVQWKVVKILRFE